MDWKHLLAKLERPLALLERVGLFVAGLAFAAMMLVTVADVVLRYALNAPLSWTFELISSYLMVGAFFLAVSATQARRQHVYVDILARHLPERLRCALAVASGCAVILLFALIWWTGAEGFLSAWQKNLVMDGEIPWPRWPTYLLIPVGLGLMLPRLVLELAGDAIAAVTGDLRTASEGANQAVCAIADQQEAAAVTAMEALGAKPWRLSAAEKADLVRRLAPVHDDWVKRMNERKLPGSQTLDAWRAASAPRS